MTEPVVRKWEATVSRADLDDWVATFQARVLNHMKSVEGFQSVTFLAQRGVDPSRVTVLTKWDDMNAVTRFAGDTPAKSVVPEFMQRYFLSADAEATFHDEILLETQT